MQMALKAHFKITSELILRSFGEILYPQTEQGSSSSSSELLFSEDGSLPYENKFDLM